MYLCLLLFLSHFHSKSVVLIIYVESRSGECVEVDRQCWAVNDTVVFGVATASTSRRSRESRELETVRRVSTAEDESVAMQQQQGVDAEQSQAVNMSVWTQRVLVRRLNPYVAEYVSLLRTLLCSCIIYLLLLDTPAECRLVTT